jgi:hypothetical protein
MNLDEENIYTKIITFDETYNSSNFFNFKSFLDSENRYSIQISIYVSRYG